MSHHFAMSLAAERQSRLLAEARAAGRAALLPARRHRGLLQRARSLRAAVPTPVRTHQVRSTA